MSNDLKDQKVGPESIYNAKLVSGGSAPELLSDPHFKSLIVEIGSVRDHAPSQEALNRFQDFLGARLNKPRGIRVIFGREIPSSPQGKYSVTQLRDLEDRYRQQYSRKDRIAVYFLFLDGRSVDDQDATRILGQAFNNTSVAVFERTLRAEAERVGLHNWVAETTVMQHEFGHLLGLVGGVPEQSAHMERLSRTHCSNPRCLMYHATDTGYILRNFNGQPPELDEACLRDLKAAGGQ